MLVLLVLAILVFADQASAAVSRDVVIDIDQSGPAERDVDGDGTKERFTADLVDEFRRVPRIRNPCALNRQIGRTDERVVIELLRVGARRPVIFVTGSSGATGRIQSTFVHRLDPPQGLDACPSLTTLFRFPHRTAKTPRPPRGTAPGSFSSRPIDKDGRLWFRTYEGLYGRDDAGCCPSYTRTIDWKPRGDRYVRAKTRVRRLR